MSRMMPFIIAFLAVVAGVSLSASAQTPSWVHSGTTMEFAVNVEVEGLDPEVGRNRYTVIAANETGYRLLLENDRMIPTGPNNELLPDTLIEVPMDRNRTLVENQMFSFWLWIPVMASGDTVRVFDKNYTVAGEEGGTMVLRWEGVQDQTLTYVTSTLRYSSKDLSLVSLLDEYHDTDDVLVMRVSMERTAFVLGSPQGVAWTVFALTGAAVLAAAASASGVWWMRRRGRSAA